jgi:hypothetical protein
MKTANLLSRLALATGLGVSSLAMAAPPTAAEVGDANSFGKKVEWIGILQTGTVFIVGPGGCAGLTPSLGPDDRCVEHTPGTLTVVDEKDLGRITLPKKSTETLICHWATPVASFRLQNTDVAPVAGEFSTFANYRFESKVLDDPSLINPITGLPFGGYIDVQVPLHTESLTLAPGAFKQQAPRATRTCIGGAISMANLVSAYGLSEKLAKRFFDESITIRGGVWVRANHVTNARVLIGTRFTGDHY